MAEEERQIKLENITWSPHHFSLFELVAKFPLPFLAKAAKTSTSDDGSTGTGRILAGEIYRILRFVQVHKVHVELLPATSGYDGSRRRSSNLRNRPAAAVELTLPKDYQGPFKILHNGPAISVKDILMSMPRYIKVLEAAKRKPHEVQLDAGDVLEVLGTTKRATKTGVIDFLRLRKALREFILHPDFEGKFQLLEDTTTYTFDEIVRRFPLPQKVSLVKPEKHSEMLLTKLPPAHREGEGSFMLVRESQEKYVIGSEINGQTGILVHMDADVDFYLPDWVTATSASTNQNDTIRKNQCVGDLHTDNMICKVNDKPILCKPWGLLFRDPPPVLPIKRPSGGSGDKERQPKHHTHDVVSSDDNDRDHDGAVESNSDSGQGSINDGTISNTSSEAEATSSEGEQGCERDTLSRRNRIITSPYVNTAILPKERKLSYVPVPALPKSRVRDSATGEIPFYASSQELRALDALDTSLTNPYKSPQQTSVKPNPNNILDVNEVDDPKYAEIGSKRKLGTVFKNSVRGVEWMHIPSPDTDSKPEPLPRHSFDAEDDTTTKPMKGVRRKNSKEIWQPTMLPSCPKTPPAFKDTQVSLSDALDEAEAQGQTVTPRREHLPSLPDICHEPSVENPYNEVKPSLPENQKQVRKLSVDQVVDVLKTLKIGNDVQKQFRANQIDGELLCSLDKELLTQEFEISQFYAMKIEKFIAGWRPKYGTRTSSLV